MSFSLNVEIVLYVLFAECWKPAFATRLWDKGKMESIQNCRICPFRRADDEDPICNSMRFKNK
jgi:hypothetical protein